MKLVGSRSNDGVELAAQCVAEVGRMLIRIGNELGRGFVRDINERARKRAIVVVDSFHVEVAAGRPLSSNHGTAGDAKPAVRCDARSLQREVISSEQSASLRHEVRLRLVLNAPGVERIDDLRCGGIERGRTLLDLNTGGGHWRSGIRLHGYVHGLWPGGIESNVLRWRACNLRGTYVEAIASAGQVLETVIPARVRSDLLSDSGIEVLQRHCCVVNGSAGG